MSKIRVLQLIGIDDTNRVEILFLSHDVQRLRYSYTGNVNILSLLKSEQLEIVTIYFGGMKGDTVKVPPPDVVFNAICDCDANKKSLNIAARAVETFHVPILNHPRCVMRTARDQIYQQLCDIQDLKAPKTIRMQPESITQVQSLIHAGGLEYPVIFREAGRHGGMNMVLLRDPRDTDPLHRFALDGRDYYALEFVDFRSPDGLFRKYRFLIIDGKPYPRHMIASDEWNIHARDRARRMLKDPALRKEEESFFGTYAEKSHERFRKVYEKLGLDFFGVDCTFDGDGGLIIFEVNSCFRVRDSEPAIEDGGESRNDTAGEDYRLPYIEAIPRAVEAMILRRAGKSG